MKTDKCIRFDWAMKRMLRDKANLGCLKAFFTVLFERKITILEILESESNQTAADDKFNRVDIKANEENGGNIIIVEVQNTRKLYYLERIFYGTSKNALMIQILGTARLEGRMLGNAQGCEEERRELARKFKNSGVPVDIIAMNTGLSEEEIAEL